MATYRLETDKKFMQMLKIESAKINKTMKQFIIEAVVAKIKNTKKV